MTAPSNHRHSERRCEGSADCRDCSWSDNGPSFRMLAGRHHHQTGHEVVTEAMTTYGRVSVADPNQTDIFDFIEGEAA